MMNVFILPLEYVVAIKSYIQSTTIVKQDILM